MEAKKLTFFERLLAPTPGFFRTIRTTGLSLTAIGGSIIAAQVSLPAIVITVGGYLIVAGGVMTAGVRQNSLFEKKGYTFVNQLKVQEV